jgi:hypothetical protein
MRASLAQVVDDYRLMIVDQGNPGKKVQLL